MVSEVVRADIHYFDLGTQGLAPNWLFDFRDFESSCGVAPRGGYSDSSGRTSTKIGDSKTKPRQEKKPESNRSSGVVIRCNDLIIRQFRVPKTALRSTK